MKTYLNHRYAGGALNLYSARLSKFSHFSIPIECRILTVVQKVVAFKSWMIENVQNFNVICSQSVVIEMKYSSIKLFFLTHTFLNLKLKISTVVNRLSG